MRNDIRPQTAVKKRMLRETEHMVQYLPITIAFINQRPVIGSGIQEVFHSAIKASSTSHEYLYCGIPDLPL